MSRIAFAALLALAPGLALAEPTPAEAPPALKPPVLVEPAAAVYPKSALADRVEAQVVLELDLDATGAVEGVTVVRSSTTAGFLPAGTRSATITAEGYGFVAAARAAAYQLVFQPAEENGLPVPVRITYTFRFQLPPLAAPAPVAKATGTSSVAAPPPPPGIPNVIGRVLERGTRAKVKGAVVTIFRGEGEAATGFEATTDAEGEFRFLDVPIGEWSVLAEADGFFPFRTVETVELGVALELTYYLERASTNPLDVLVEAPRPKKEVNRRTLTTSEIVKVPGTLGDPILVVENLPGVARAQGGDIIVRGSGPEDTKVYIDGINVPLIYHFGGLRSVVPAEMIETVDFYPGNFSSYYGRAIGGVFDAHLYRPKSERFRGVLDISLLDASLFVEIPVTDDLWIAAAGRRSYVDAVLAAVVPDDGAVSLTSAPKYYDGQLIVRWRASAAHELRASALFSDDTLELLFKNPGDLDAQVQARNLSAATRFWRAFAEHDYTPSTEVRNELDLAVGQDIISTRLGDQFRFDLDVVRITLRDAATFTLADWVTLTAGVDLEYTHTYIDIKAPGSPPKEGDPTQGGDLSQVIVATLEDIDWLSVAPYVEAELALGPVALVPGLRLDYYQQLEQVSLSPRLVARWSFAEEWVAKGGVALVQQTPTPDESSVEFGNPNLGVEQALQYSLGAEWRPLPYLTVDLTFFYKDMFDLVSRTSASRVEEGRAIPLVYDNGGTGRVYGLELYLKHDLARNLSGWLTYTLSRAERTDSGGGGGRLFDFDQTHILALVAQYRFPENWELGLRWRVVSGNPYTPFVGGVFRSDADRYEPIPGAVNSGRLPLFHQLDLRLDKRWIFDTWVLSAYLSLTNAYNRPNVEGFTYNFDFTESTPQNGLPIYPILGVRAEL